MVSDMTDIEKQIKEAAAILKKRGVVAYPTDTVYGLGACMTDVNAVDRIFQVKGRPKGMALPVLLADLKQIEEIVTDFTPAAKRLAEEFFPGALTIILPKNASVPDIITGGGKTIAFRIPNHPVPLALVKGFGQADCGNQRQSEWAPQRR